MVPLCLLLCNRQRTLATAQLLHSTAHVFLCGSALESIRDDVPGAVHLTDTFHFLCPGATLCLLSCVLKPPWHLPQPTLRELMSPKAWSPPKPHPTCTMWSPASQFSLPLHVRETRVTERKGQTCRSPTNSTSTGDSALKVERRIKGPIIVFNSEMGQRMKLLRESGLKQRKAFLN